jgi:hypothetical protein
MYIQVSALLRNELQSMQNGSDVNAVRELAIHILELQVQEAGKSTTSCLQVAAGH